MAKILIVEDEKVLNEAYELVLRKNGYTTVSVFNGEEALAAFQKGKFDLVLLDLRMPKLDGVQFLKKINPAVKYPDTKIIVFSNYDDPKEVSEAMSSGATRYILKAWSSPGDLVKLVKDTLRQD